MGTSLKTRQVARSIAAGAVTAKRSVTMFDQNGIARVFNEVLMLFSKSLQPSLFVGNQKTVQSLLIPQRTDTAKELVALSSSSSIFARFHVNFEGEKMRCS